MPLRPKTDATHYHAIAQLGLPDKYRAIKGLIICTHWLGYRAKPLDTASCTDQSRFDKNSKVLRQPMKERVWYQYN